MATALGVTAANALIQFDTATPDTIVASVPITGLVGGDSIVGLDFRPATGQLYGMGSGSRLYTINPTSGVATQVGTNGAFTLSGTDFGFDFNPVPDRVRVTSNSDQNLRLNPNNGTLVATDGTLAYAGGDPNAAVNPNIVASAYTNSFGGSTATTLYNIDSGLDTLVIQNPPNSGTLNTVVGAGLGINIQGVAGFDIQALSGGGNAAFAAFTTDGISSSLYTINLTSGAATLVGGIGTSGTLIVDLAIVPDIAPTAVLYGIDAATNNLVRVNSNNPSTVIGSIPITGLVGGDTIIGLDFRPATGLLYGLGSGSRLYTIDTSSGVATQVGSDGAFTLSGTAFGFNFNPVPDRVRLTSDLDQNIRLNPNDGTLSATDGTLAFAVGDPNAAANPNIVASAYTNSFAGATTTTLYDIDSTLDALVIQNPPNAGTLNTVVGSGLGIDIQSVAGFDIRTINGVNVAYAALSIDGVSSSLYTIDLTTGVATQVGSTPIGGTAPLLLRALAVAPFGSFQFSAPTYSVGENGPVATITVDRTLGSEGVATVRVATSDGTATQPADYTAFDQILIFAPGETSKTIQIPIVDDGLAEFDETINLTLTAATGGAVLGTQATAVLTILDDDAAPVAVADTYTTPESTALTVAGPGILANDSDANSDPLTAVLVTGPTNGNLVLNADGSFTYTPNAGFVGTDSFVYQASDGFQTGNSATVTLTVTNVNDPPVAVSDTYTTSQGTTLTIAGPGVLANDSDPDSDPLTAVLVTGPTNGTLTLNPNGSFTYTPNTGYFGTDTFVYQASDGVALSNSIAVTILVTQVITAPVALPDTFTVSAGTVLTVAGPGVLANDASPMGTPLTVQLVSGTTNGTLTLNANGSFIYTPNAGFAGIDTFSYRDSDGTSLSNTVSVTIAVNAVNGPPVALADFYNATQGTPLVVAGPGVLGNDFDPDGTALTAVLVTGPTNGTLTLNPNGSFTYTPNAGFVGTDSFRYQASDGVQPSSTATVSLTVVAVNAAPVVPASQTVQATSGQALSTPAPGVLANATDANGNTLTAVLVSLPTNGMLTLNPNGSYIYTPNAGFVGQDQFTFRASDGAALSNVGTVIVNVSPAAVSVGPRVLGVLRYGTLFQRTNVVLQFDGPIDGITANILSNYRVTRPNGTTVAVRAIRFITGTNQVVLILAQRLPQRGKFGLVVNGGPGGIRSTTGVALDGAGTNRPGTNFSTTFNRSNFAGPARLAPR